MTYIIANVDVTDPDAYAEYRKDVAATLEPFGGHFLTRGGRAQALEGSYAAKRIVILEFPDYERAKGGGTRRATGACATCASARRAGTDRCRGRLG